MLGETDDRGGTWVLMALEVRCDCGNVYSLDAKMAGRKVRCGNCGQVVRVPEVTAAPEATAAQELDLGPAPTDDIVAAPRPMELPENMLSMEDDDASAPISEDDLPDFDVSDDDAEEPEIPRCPVCGNECDVGDSVCLACGAEIDVSGVGALNKILAKFPKKARIGVAAGLGVALLLWVAVAIWRAGRDSSYVAEGNLQLELTNYKEAQKSFAIALEWNPRNLDAISGGVKCALKSQQSLRVFVAKLSGLKRSKEPYDKKKAGAVYFALATHYSNKIKDGKSDPNVSIAQTYAARVNTLTKGEIKGLSELRGHINFKVGDWIQARNFYQAAIENETGDPLVLLNMARIERKDGNVEKASEYILKAETSNPAEANVELAKIKESQREWRQALVHWKKAVTAKEDLHSARVGYGRALLRDAKVKEGFVQAKEAKKLVSDDPATLALLCEALYRLGRYSPALTTAKELLALDAGNVVGQFYKGAVLLQQGLSGKDSKKMRQGESLITKTVRARKNPVDYVAAARILGQVKGRLNVALQMLTNALKIDKKLAEAHFLNVELLEKTNNLARVKKALEDALVALPQDISLNSKLADIYWGESREIKAIEMLRKLKRSHPDNVKVVLILANRLYDRAKEERDEPIPDEDREPLLKEAQKLFEDVKNRLKSTDPDVPIKIKAVKTQLLPFG
jgi:tetratricopeptide (TPR) repeat protein